MIDAHTTALVVGGGIGGLSAALSLARQGLNTELFERAPEFAEVGAGIQLSPNATRVLFALGLEAPLRAACSQAVGGEVRHWRSGRVLSRFPLGQRVQARFGFPFLQAHRADLVEIMAAAAMKQERIRLHQHALVTGFEQTASAVRLAYQQPRGEQIATGDVLIGADGLASSTRQRLFDAESPRFTGNIAWRALVPAERLPNALMRPVVTLWWGPGGHVVQYFVRTGALMNCVWIVEKRGWEVESWHERGDRGELEADFRGWHEDVRILIDCLDAGSLYKWALFDRPPLATWGRGRVTLIGDACHPALPFMAQGAAMAIEDAAVLANCLADRRHADAIESRLTAYAALRQSRANEVQRRARRLGRVFHMRGIFAAVRNLGLRFLFGRLPWAGLYRYDALQRAKMYPAETEDG